MALRSFGIGPLNVHILRAHILDKFLLPTLYYSSSSDSSLVKTRYLIRKVQRHVQYGKPEAEARSSDRHSRIFGISALVLAFITAMYDAALTETFREGFICAGKHPVDSIVHRDISHFIQHVDAFSNNWTCPENLEKDYECANLKELGCNCAIFDFFCS